MDGAQAESEVVGDATSPALQEAAAATKVERMNLAARGIRPGGQYAVLEPQELAGTGVCYGVAMMPSWADRLSMD